MNNKIKIAQALKVLEKTNAKKNYYSYVKYTHESYLYNRHGEFIADTINGMLERRERMIRGDEQEQTQYLMLSLPP